MPELEPEAVKVHAADGATAVLRLFHASETAAPTCLCLPAMGVRASYYEELGRQLARAGLHAATLDLRGHGDSSMRARRGVNFGYREILDLDLPAAVDALRALGRERITIVGHSLGGQLGLLFACTSERVDGVVLVASGSNFYGNLPRARGLGRWLGVRLVRLITRVCGYFPGERLSFAGREAAQLIRDWSHEALTGHYAVRDVDYEASLRGLRLPVLFLPIVGDRYVTTGCARFLAAKLEAASVSTRDLTAADLGMARPDHFRWLARPGAAASAIASWHAQAIDRAQRSRNVVLEIEWQDLYGDAYDDSVATLRHAASWLAAGLLVDHLVTPGGWVEQPRATTLPEEPAARLVQLLPQKLIAYLEDRGELRAADGRLWPSPELLGRAGGPAPDSSYREICEHLRAVGDRVLAGGDGLAQMAARTGESATMALWEHLMVDAPPKRPCNILMARTLHAALRAKPGLRVFEGGGGVGAVLRAALALPGFAHETHRLGHYYLTDISRSLLDVARGYLGANAPRALADRLTYHRVDLDLLGESSAPFAQADAVDLVVLENVLHDVHDLANVLTAVRRMLRDDGLLAFTTGCRGRPGDFFPFEILQSTLHSYHRARLDPPRRTTLGYLPLPDWERSLAAAGFSRWRTMPTPDRLGSWPYFAFLASQRSS